MRTTTLCRGWLVSIQSVRHKSATGDDRFSAHVELDKLSTAWPQPPVPDIARHHHNVQVPDEFPTVDAAEAATQVLARQTVDRLDAREA
jgi:hypothetical protein